MPRYEYDHKLIPVPDPIIPGWLFWLAFLIVVLLCLGIWWLARLVDRQRIRKEIEDDIRSFYDEAS